MCDIRVSGRGVSITDSLRNHANEKLTSAVKVFDIEPMTCDIVLRCDKNKSNPESNVCEVTVKVPKSVVRVSVASRNMYDAIDDDALVREKVIKLDPMSLEEALVQIDLIGHDFYMFEDSATGLINVVYRRENGGYGVLRPDVTEEVAVA